MSLSIKFVLRLVTVYHIQVIPVNITDIIRICHPCFLQPCSCSCIRIIARQITIIIRTRIWTSIPCQCRITILSETKRSGYVQLRTVCNIERIIQHSKWFMIITNTGITTLPILPSPVRIIVIVSYQIICLLCRSLLCTAFCRSAQYS